ncbi:MAG: mandelate racemase/muconate lactonizing enzyme family protein [Verrucomicrobiota bacterium]|nr:mandelate racemase/muconate lactonizing enzyme family protein [Verrucomicrobiota bacterium]
MKITKIETLWFEAVPEAEWRKTHPNSRQAAPNNLWVRIHADDSLVGLGETYYLPGAVASVIHDVYAPLLIGRDPLDIENHWNNLFALVNFCGFAGAEMRALSAIDLALWDLAGQHLGQPIYNLLGGRTRDRIPLYNTCVDSGKYRDLSDFMNGRAGTLAEDLLRQGIRAMKIWPFDQFGPTLAGPEKFRQPVVVWGATTAAGVLGHSLTNEELKRGVSVVEDIRRAVGDRMDIAIEGHSRWDLPTAIRIARALELYGIMWLEEIMPPDNVEAYVRLKTATRIPICQSERVFTRFGFRPWIEKHAADIIMPDLSWGGGLTEGRKIASLADTYYLPVTCHDTIGPVALWAAVHFMLHIPNALIMETVRGYIDGWYNEVITDRIPISEGHLSLPKKPGLGTRLQDNLTSRPGAQVKITTEETLRRW